MTTIKMINHLVPVAIWISCHIPINTAAIFRPLLKFRKMAEIPITNHLAIEYNYHTCVTETFDLVTLKLLYPQVVAKTTWMIIKIRASYHLTINIILTVPVQYRQQNGLYVTLWIRNITPNNMLIWDWSVDNMFIASIYPNCTGGYGLYSYW